MSANEIAWLLRLIGFSYKEIGELLFGEVEKVGEQCQRHTPINGSCVRSKNFL